MHIPRLSAAEASQTRQLLFAVGDEGQTAAEQLLLIAMYNAAVGSAALPDPAASVFLCPLRARNAEAMQIRHPEPQLVRAAQQRVRQRLFNIETIRSATSVGIVVLTLAVEGYRAAVDHLRHLLRSHNKRCYVIYVGYLDAAKLANFEGSVDCFVAVACPHARCAHFPTKDDGLLKPLVGLVEAVLALMPEEEAQKQLLCPDCYTTAFPSTILCGSTSKTDRHDFDEGPTAASVCTCGCRGGDGSCTCGGSHSPTGPTSDDSHGGALIADTRSNALVTAGRTALQRLNERTFCGLDSTRGTEVQPAVVQGKRGIARHYENL